jgi:peptidoglycan/LPS O-acetylase OafA/YrhL
METPLTTPQPVQQNQPLLRSVMPELDIIRGIAVLGVLFYHGLYAGIDLTPFAPAARLLLSTMWVGRLGVNLFFVLSGFLITGLLVDSKQRPDYYSRFYIRRALRILPAYLLTILLLIFVWSAPWKFVGLSLLYLSNLTPLWGIAISYPVLWSLAVEEHFYFLWPTIVRNLKVPLLVAICVAIILLSPVSRLAGFFLSHNAGPSAYVCNEYTWNSSDGLACGALLALWLRFSNPSRRAVWRAVSVLFVIALLIWTLFFPWGIWTRQTPFGASLQVVPWHLLFVALLAFFLLVGTSPWKQLVNSKILRFFGDISYGLYLYHLLAFFALDALANRASISWLALQPLSALLLRFLIGATLAIAVSFLSRRFLEDPFLALKTKFTAR